MKAVSRDSFLLRFKAKFNEKEILKLLNLT